MVIGIDENKFENLLIKVKSKLIFNHKLKGPENFKVENKEEFSEKSKEIRSYLK